MINLDLYNKKLDILGEWINLNIDDLSDRTSLYDRFRQIETDFAMREINKPKLHDGFSIDITDHAYDRAKERLTMNRSSFGKLAQKAYYEGVKHIDAAGKLKRWMDSIWFSHKSATNMRIYGEVFFLFCKTTLITVYQVPNNLRKSALKIQKNE